MQFLLLSLIPLYIFRGFYIGPASLKTSPSLGALFVKKRVYDLGCMEGKEWKKLFWVTSFIFA